MFFQQSLMLSIAKDLLEEEEIEREEERGRYMAESCPPPSLPRSMQELQVCQSHVLQLPIQHPYNSWNSLPTHLDMVLFCVVVQELCREIHRKIDKTDEERYDLEMKVNKTNKEVNDTEQINLLYSAKPLSKQYTLASTVTTNIWTKLAVLPVNME